MQSYKLATVWGILLWFLIFAVYSVLMFAVKQVKPDLLMLLLSPILALFCGWMYFRGVKKASIQEGLFLGLYFVAVGSVLDLAVTVPFFVRSFTTYYGDWTLWASFAFSIVFTGIAGYASMHEKKIDRKLARKKK